jgi:hypothetical protein
MVKSSSPNVPSTHASPYTCQPSASSVLAVQISGRVIVLFVFRKPLLTYLLTPWGRVLLEKLTVNFAASQEIPRIYGTQKFLTVPTSARHLSLF